MQLEGIDPPRPGLEPLPVQDLGVYERHGGHTLRRHVNTPPGDELRRILREGIVGAGHFLNRVVAQRCIEVAIGRHAAQIRAWLTGPEANVPLTIVENMGEVIGRSLTWDDVSHGLVTPKPVTGMRMVLRQRSELPGGFTVVTAYPTRARRRPRHQKEA